MKTIEEEFEFYYKSVYPQGTGARQNAEVRQAFLAGALVAIAKPTEAMEKFSKDKSQANAALNAWARDVRARIADRHAELADGRN